MAPKIESDDRDKKRIRKVLKKLQCKKPTELTDCDRKRPSTPTSIASDVRPIRALFRLCRHCSVFLFITYIDLCILLDM